MIEKALAALKGQGVMEREISSNTMTLHLSALPEIKKEIKKFQKKIGKIAKRKKGDSVYQLNTQFFRLTKRGSKNENN